MNRRRLMLIARQEARKALDGLPPPLREAAGNCAIEFCVMHELLGREPDLDEDLLGLFEGCTRFDPPSESPADLPRIRLFLDNLWDYTEADAQRFRAEVRVTLLHELGHYLGLDEDQVNALGLG